MKMVKSLLLGSAAGLVAVTAGQAAELPVKAKPVQYVKVCSLYGAGFYYMPGTDMCLKIGGWVRAEATDNSNGNLAWGPYNANSNTRATNDLTVRARGYITADAREQTAYGVARGYIAVGISTNTTGADTASNTFSSNRAFVQWAGFTAGLSRSFYDFYNAAVQNYRAGYVPQEDTGDAGWYVWAYTAQFGGGLTATLSLEGRRTTQIVDQNGGAGTIGSTAGFGSVGAFTALGGYGGWDVPDVVANIRVDQAWGSAQIMGAVHELNPSYFDLATGTSNETAGHASNAWGWVIGAGAHINLPTITPGDYIEGEVNYTQGALKYLFNGQGTNFDNVQGTSQSYGVAADCVQGGVISSGTSTSCQLSTGWSAVVSYEHYWTPQWHESFTGGYLNVSYAQGTGSANSILCVLEGQGAGAGTTSTATAGCNNNWSYWAAGSRLQWDVTKSFYIGVEAMYNQQITATSATGFVPIPAGIGSPTLCGTGVCTNSNENNWAFTVRMHKDFLP